jgi:hypothetical protein
MDAIDPAAQVDQTAAVRAEGKRRQIAQAVDSEGFRASWTPALNHQTVPLVEPDEDADDVG